MKANVILPAGSWPVDTGVTEVKAKGVVLFMHGFAQGPTAYARMLHELARAYNVVVVAPCPPFKTSLEPQQEAMVEAALFWRKLIHTNGIPNLKVKAEVEENTLPVGLLAHSVGGGLAPYVVHECAKEEPSIPSMPFVSAHVMAPQTYLVVCKYKYEKLKSFTTETKWGLQYGWADLLSPAPCVTRLKDWLEEKKLLSSKVEPYLLGTHVGFQDQLVWNGASFVLYALPWVLSILAVVLLLKESALRIIKHVWDLAQNLAPPPVEPQTPVVHRGADDIVRLPDERMSLTGYFALVLLVTAIVVLPPSDSGPAGVVGVLKVPAAVLAAFGWPAVCIYLYEATTQRPDVRKKVIEFHKDFFL